MNKKDFITRACIYANVCVVGKKENVQLIVNAVQEMQMVMRDIVRQLGSGDFSLSDDNYRTYKEDLLATCISVVEILDGAAYLFEKSDIDADEKHRRYIEELKAAIEKTDEAEADL